MQSRLESLIEQILSTFFGLFVAIGGQLVIFPVMGINIHLGQNFTIAAFFTILSVARGYVVRRVFNWRARRRHESRPQE